MTRYPGDQGATTPGPRDGRDPRMGTNGANGMNGAGGPNGPSHPYTDTSGGVSRLDLNNTGLPGGGNGSGVIGPQYPYSPAPGAPTIQPLPGHGGPPAPHGDATANFRNRGQYQLAPGTQLQGGRYVIEDVVGSGGMGHVYRGRDTRLNRVRAIKEMIPQLGDPEAGIINYTREAQVMLEIENPNIPEVFDTFTEHHRAYIVLQFIEGENLEQRLNATAGFLSERQVGGWALQLCQIVTYLHEHQPPIIFRDIKPNNIIVTPRNRIVLIDFGIAKNFNSNDQHTNVGTNGYAAKEQYLGRAEPRSDIYSIGATMHHLLTRSDPRQNLPFTFAERMPRSLNPEISEAMEAVIMKACAVEKENRYQTCEELARAIESALGLAPVDDTGVFRVKRSQDWDPQLGPTGTLRIGPDVLWAFATGDEVRSTPLVAGDTVYVGSYDKSLYALDRNTGGLRWKYATGDGVCGRPAAWQDMVFIGSEDSSVYALNARSGALVWRYPTARYVRSSPRVFNDILYIGSDDGSMYALDPRTGKQIWRYTTYREVTSSAAYSRGLIVFGSRDDYVYAVDAQTGDKKWSFRTNAGVISTPLVEGEQVYVGSSDFTVYCLELKTGWRAWEERTDKFVLSSPAIAGDFLYIGSTDNHLYCLNRRTGRRQWRYRTGHQINSTPYVAGNVVYFGSIDRSIYGLDTTTGALRWRFETDGMVPGSPVVDQGVVFVGSADRNVYALRAVTS